jgi:hypothetical protein
VGRRGAQGQGQGQSGEQEPTQQVAKGDFDESKHPREPAGSPEGGRFTSGGGGGGTDLGEKAGYDRKAITAAAKEIISGGDDVSEASGSPVDIYQSPAFKAINAALREGGDLSQNVGRGGDATIESVVKGVDEAVASGTLKEPIVTYRGGGAGLADGLEVGATINDKGFVSTTLNSQVAAKFARGDNPTIVKMELPAGHHGYLYKFDADNELLLGRDSKFTVTAINKGVTYKDWIGNDMQVTEVVVRPG